MLDSRTKLRRHKKQCGNTYHSDSDSEEEINLTSNIQNQQKIDRLTKLITSVYNRFEVFIEENEKNHRDIKQQLENQSKEIQASEKTCFSGQESNIRRNKLS